MMTSATKKRLADLEHRVQEVRLEQEYRQRNRPAEQGALARRFDHIEAMISALCAHLGVHLEEVAPRPASFRVVKEPK